MNNNCIFTTHATLTKEHAEYSLKSLLSNQHIPLIWDWFIIYNTHPETIDNEWLQNKIKEFDIYGCIKNLAIFPYEMLDCKKTLTQDIINQFQILIENDLTIPGKTLLLKSDYCVSTNFNYHFSQLSSVNTLWSLPIYNAKSKVTIDEIIELCNIPKFTPILDGCYYRGGTNEPITPGSFTNPYIENSFNGELDTHPSIRVVAHNIQNDYNLHVFTNDIIKLCHQICVRCFNTDSTWGGAHDLFNIAFNQAGIKRSTSIDSFGVHLYHGIKSINCEHERGDHRKTINGEEY